MTKLEWALYLGQLGFHVFPLGPGQKIPVWPGAFREYATNDESRIRTYWNDPLFLNEDISIDYNIGISTTRFRESEALVVVDIDIDKERNIDGFKTVEENGFEFPATFTVRSPRGGIHYYYKALTAISIPNGLGHGIDIQSFGKLIVGPGSDVKGREYEIVNDVGIFDCPQWILDRANDRKSVHTNGHAIKPIQNGHGFDRRVIDFLSNSEEAEQGSRTHLSYRVACGVKDLGLDKADAVSALQVWNEEKCYPPLTPGELQHQVESAYKYGVNPIGAALPENDFEEINPDDYDPVLKYNKEHMYVVEGGRGVIFKETKDRYGKFHLQRIQVPTFHEFHAADTILQDKKLKQTSRLWICHPKRRTYARVVFEPGVEVPKEHYNAWKGWNVEAHPKGKPVSQKAQEGLDLFIEHIFDNVCEKNQEHFNFVMGFFAHMFQKPWEKIRVAIALRGQKGVGKDTISDIVGHLVGPRHYVMEDSPRLLTDKFNAQLEFCQFLSFNEAFWGADKKAEAKLKNYTTGRIINIERKGSEVTPVPNYLRILIMGNAKHLVPATQGERRYAVFQVGTGKMQDNVWFGRMFAGMEAGGYELLLRYFLDFDISGLELNVAPVTKWLDEQKEEHLDSDPLGSWWLDSLIERRILGDTDSDWPDKLYLESVTSTIDRHLHSRNIGTRRPSSRAIAKFFLSIGIEKGQEWGRDDTHRGKSFYKIPPLDECRKVWDKYMNTKTEWEGT